MSNQARHPIDVGQNRGGQRAGHGCLLLAGLFLIVFLRWVTSDTEAIPSPATTVPSPSPQVAQPSPEEQAKTREALVTELAPLYCQNHKQTTVQEVDVLVAAGFPTHKDILKHGFTDAQCRTIIDKLYDITPDRDELEEVAERKYWIGMDARLLVFSIGTPHRVNNTQTAFGETGQWIYEWSGGSSNYFYIENGKVMSWQDYQ
jgi:hypothetical protein